MTVNHDDLWTFEGKNIPIHWHNDLEISIPRVGKMVFQIYQKSYCYELQIRFICRERYAVVFLKR